MAAILVGQSSSYLLARDEPIETAVINAEVLKGRTDQPGYVLRLTVTADLSGNCIRTTNINLVNERTQTVWPLGKLIAGRKFGTPWTGPFIVEFDVPRSVPPGRHLISIRSVYDCDYGPDIVAVTYRIPKQGPIVPVVIP